MINIRKEFTIEKKKRLGIVILSLILIGVLSLIFLDSLEIILLGLIISIALLLLELKNLGILVLGITLLLLII